MRHHQFADLFPMMPEADLDAMASDIKANGLRDPIVILGGYILDGRNRYKACEKAGVEPKFEHFPLDGDALAFVLSKNLKRRHLTDSQRAMVAAELATLADGQKKPATPQKREEFDEGAPIGAPSTEPETDPPPPPAVSQNDAAKALNVSRRSVQRARKVKESGNAELVAEVKNGEKTVAAAEREVKAKASQPTQVSEQPAPVDSWGVPIQPHAEAAFAAVPKFQELIAAVRKVQQLFSEVAELEGGKFLTKPFVAECRRGKKGEPDRFISTDLDTALTKIKNAVPTHTVCPWNYVEAGHPEDCKTCHGLNWTTPLSKNAEVAKPKVQEVFGVHV